MLDQKALPVLAVCMILEWVLVNASMGQPSGTPSSQVSTFVNMSTSATDVVVGVVASVSYNEDIDAAVLGRERDTLGYKIRVLPGRVLRGTILPYGKRKDKAESGAITVYYRDRTPFSYSGSIKVLFRPEVGLTYLLYLTPRKETDAFDLADSSLGILPILPLLGQAEKKDEWGLLLGTLESGDMPRYIHDTMFDMLIHSREISEEMKIQLRDANKKYYKQLLFSIQQSAPLSSSSEGPMPEQLLRVGEYREAMLGTWYNTATNDVFEDEKQHLPHIESVTFSSNRHVQIAYISSNQVHTFSGKYKTQFLGQTAVIFIVSTNAMPVPIQSLKGQIPFLQENGEPCLEFVRPQSTARNILTKHPLRK